MSDAEGGPFSDVASLTEADVQKGQMTDLSIMGFSMMCAWHFLVIFSAIPSTNTDALEGRQFVLQLVLLLSLAISYALLAVWSKPLISLFYRRGERRWTVSNVCIGIIASIASAMMVFLPHGNLPLSIATFVLLGCAGALLMFPWLQLPQVKDDKTGNYRNLAFNMGIGGVLAIVVGNLQAPLIIVALCALPLLANIMLVVYWNKSERLRKETVASMEYTHRFKPSDVLTTNVHFIITGIAFGMCQAAFSANILETGNVSFVLNGMLPLLGVPASALFVYFVPTKYLKSHGVFAFQRISLLIFFASLFLYLYFSASASDISGEAFFAGNAAAQAIFMCGFNVFDFGFMVFAFTWAARLKTDFATYIGYNRSMLYLSMGAGLALGYCFMVFLPIIPNLNIVIAGIASVMLAAVMLPFFDDFAPYGKIVSIEKIRKEEEEKEKEREQAEERAHAAHWRERVDEIADTYNLSKREREVFGYLAKGRNASYIQQELWISIHTVKTHMFNIYRKLDVHSIQEIIDMVESRNGQAGSDAEAKNGQSRETESSLDTSTHAASKSRNKASK